MQLIGLGSGGGELRGQYFEWGWSILYPPKMLYLCNFRPKKGLKLCIGLLLTKKKKKKKKKKEIGKGTAPPCNPHNCINFDGKGTEIVHF